MNNQEITALVNSLSLSHSQSQDSINKKLTTKLSQVSFVPLENIYLSRNGSYLSECGLSFSTEQIQPSNRISMLEDTIEICSTQFKFERKVQNSLRPKSNFQKFCNKCKTNVYFVEKKELAKLSFLQVLNYWIKSLRCCSEPTILGKFHVKRLYCIYCGSSVEV